MRKKVSYYYLHEGVDVGIFFSSDYHCRDLFLILLVGFPRVQHPRDTVLCMSDLQKIVGKQLDSIFFLHILPINDQICEDNRCEYVEKRIYPGEPINR